MNSSRSSLQRPADRIYQAVTRGGGIYPLKGLYIFLTHKPLHPLLKARLLPCALLSTLVLALLFLLTYIPQVALLALFHRTGSAWFNGTILVLGEGAALVQLLFEAFFVDYTQRDIFDSVLLMKGREELVRGNRPVAEEVDEQGQWRSPPQRLGEPMGYKHYSPFSFRQIIEFLILLPLNLVPYVGVPLFLLFTGYRAGPLLMWRYFKLKGMDRKTRNAFVKRRRWHFTWYGMVYLVMQLVPVFSMLCLLTTAAGGASWAADMEEEMDVSAGTSREGNRREEGYGTNSTEGEYYEDDPV